MTEKKYRLRGKTKEELAQDYRKFIENPTPEWVEYNGFQEHCDKIGNEYRLKKTVKLLDTGHHNETVAEVYEKSTK